MLRRILRPLRDVPLARKLRLWLSIRALERELRQSARAISPRPHGLADQLYLSLTSFPPRFGTLHLTLETLLQQTVAPDGILLWIAHEDMERLPAKVRNMAGRGVTIRACDDVRSYKKLVFALEAFPESIIVTADDDVYYPPDWLETLVREIDPNQAMVLCHRAHRIAFTASGGIAPYRDWELDVQDAAAREPSTDLVPIGIGGILYPPGCFAAEVTDRRLFTRLAPAADDLWFYWMARKAGTRHRKVGGKFPRRNWLYSQEHSLYNDNISGGNDRQVEALAREFGLP